MIELIVGSVLGLVTAGASGIAAVGVKRLLKHTDVLSSKVDDHGVAIAEMKLKLPNGEWRAIKADVAAVGAGVTAVSVDVAALRGELGAHVYSCKQILAAAAPACPPKLRPARRSR
jgi:hypothetical protein